MLELVLLIFNPLFKIDIAGLLYYTIQSIILN